MTRPVIIGASYNKEKNLAQKVRKHYKKTTQPGRVPEVAFWRGKHLFSDFLKPNFLINELPVLAYTAIEPVLNSQSELVVVGDEVSAAITRSMSNYFEREIIAGYEPSAPTMHGTMQAGLDYLRRPDEFVFLASDLIFNQASKYTTQELTADVHLRLPSKQLIYPQAGAGDWPLNRQFQFPLLVNGEEHDCKEPNVYVFKNKKRLHALTGAAFAARKGCDTRAQLVLHAAKQVVMNTPVSSYWQLVKSAGQEVVHARTTKQLSGRVGLSTQPVLDYLASIGLETSISLSDDFGDVFDVDSAWDLALANHQLATNPYLHSHADALEAYKQDEMPRLRERFKQLRPEVFAQDINTYVGLAGQPPLLTSDARVREEYVERYSLNDEVLPLRALIPVKQ